MKTAVKALAILLAMTVFSSRQAFANPWLAGLEEMGKESKAMENGDWAEALKWAKAQNYSDGLSDDEVIAKAKSDVLAANAAAKFLTRFMLNWNLRQFDDAKRNLRQCILTLKHGQHLGDGCEVYAEALKKKVDNGDLSKSLTFTFHDMTANAGVHNAVMKVPYAMGIAKMKAESYRFEVLGRMFDSMNRSAMLEGQRIERDAKFKANQEFSSKYNRDFDPDRRPAEGTRMRDDWDACKRVHDIFD